MVYGKKGKEKMSKYDFEVDLSQNSSTGIILNKIPQGADVLEFGCAMGRMTRYMKQVLGCRICIVENDPRAYETALEYAQDGLCDDIMQFRWVQHFQGKKFDAIIFADVLEHLTDPGEVLKRAAEFLKDEGHLYISVPNVTHNDVLLKAYGEHFDYTPIGLLDDTHVHFWGMENLQSLAAASGLFIQRLEGTYCPTGCTEQWDQARERNLLLENILRERRCGEVYQFVLCLGKKPAPELVRQFKASSIQSFIYLDTGNDFTADACIPAVAEYSGQGSYYFRQVITDTDQMRRIRFDPVEGQSCILRRIQLTQGGQELELVCPGGADVPGGIFLPGDDPMVYARVQPNAGAVTIEADIVLAGQVFVELMQQAYISKYAQTVGLNNQNAQLQQQYADLLGDKNWLWQQYTDLLGDKNQLAGCVERLSEEKSLLERDLGAYIRLAGEKDLISLKLERDIAAMTEQNLQLHQANTALRGELDAYVALTTYYRNLKVVRVRAFLARIAKGIIRRVKRLMRKEEHG